eukprot:TRINITY_DN11328_c0_g1_i1.p1 TRINITY_DN11328_c0_g1~~TRINITY_DN11328_c0_g1_i1.p1  ORF type:complete len:252 (+),score=34.05 TRINITY_DN11328_c0_g1_i1:171-926(+)
MDERRLGIDQIKCCLRKLAGVSGFKHFNIEIRGQEEALLTVRQSDTNQIDISTLTLVEKGNAPSKPVTEIVTSDVTVFEIGIYKSYNRPIVWCRDKGKTDNFDFVHVPRWSGVGDSHHYARSHFDNPLYLQSCIDWDMNPSQISLADIIEEVLHSSLSPPPENCWEVDYGINFLASVTSHPCLENLAQTAALMSFLHLVPSSEFIIRDVMHLHHLYSEGMRLLVADVKKARPACTNTSPYPGQVQPQQKVA